jgi:hypothetical protein
MSRDKRQATLGTPQATLDVTSVLHVACCVLCVAAVVLMWVAWSPSVLACPTCKEALFDPAQAQQTLATAKGYATSIGLLLGTMGLLIGGVTTAVIRSARRQRREI